MLRYGGNPQQSNRKGETPLKVASSPTMVNLLLGKGTYTSSEESSTGKPAQQAGKWVGGAVYCLARERCAVSTYGIPLQIATQGLQASSGGWRLQTLPDTGVLPGYLTAKMPVLCLLRYQPCLSQSPVGSFCLWLASDGTKVLLQKQSRPASPPGGGLIPPQVQSILN